tara:strand:- start:970 stop:1953 length:984 start_codon:yes stop_codon:yes gene_type:complete
MDTISPVAVDQMSITVLMDNHVSNLLDNIGPVTRPSIKEEITAPLIEDGSIKSQLRAEHGFSAWVTIKTGEVDHSILFDAGVSPTGVSENMRILDLSPKNAEAIVFSHGHFDHTVGIDGVMNDLGTNNIPIIIHPEFWNRRRIVLPGRTPRSLPTVSKSALREQGMEIIEETRLPSFLLDDSLLVTGEVDRITGYEKGMKGQEVFVEGSWQPDPLTLDDQALIAKIKDKGLVIMTGCGHAGVVNICNYAKKLTGENKIHAIIGGFHLPDTLNPMVIENTVSDIKNLNPDWLIPAHCTGQKAIMSLMKNHSQSMIQNSVGSQYKFGIS